MGREERHAREHGAKLDENPKLGGGNEKKYKGLHDGLRMTIDRRQNPCVLGRNGAIHEVREGYRWRTWEKF